MFEKIAKSAIEITNSIIRYKAKTKDMVDPLTVENWKLVAKKI